MKTCPTCHGEFPLGTTICPNDGTALAAEPPLWADGSIVRGKYRILRRVGVGGMASVYKAEHIHFKEFYALKVIKPDLAHDEVFVERFMREAVLTRRLQHPFAVRVDDIDRAEDGRPFIVMEFLEGASLHEVMYREQPLPYRKVRSIVRQVASALDAAHAIGIIHRDVKPANITMVKTAQGEIAKVVDFGIAKAKEARLDAAFEQDLTLTSAGMLIGTPAYMSPEQAMGKRGSELDGRSDLYSFAVVLYEMLTGRLPVQANTEEQYLIAHATVAPSPIQNYAPGLPPSVSALIMRCLAKDPDERPWSGVELIEEMDRWEKGQATTLDERPIPIPPSPQLPPPPAKAKFSMQRLALAAMALSLLLFLGALVYFLRARFFNSSPAATPAVQASYLTMPSGDMVLVTDGEALLGEHNTKRYVKSFYIDKTEVSTRAYLEFCAATNHPLPPDVSANEPDLPVRNVDLADARAFAAWAHKRLPTAVEWERAARGTQGDHFPWGNGFGAGMARLATSSAETNANLLPSPVSAFPQGASACNALNLVGNVWEWMDGPSSQIRGGGYRTYPPDLNMSYEALVYQGEMVDAGTRRPDLGFRCVRSH